MHRWKAQYCYANPNISNFRKVFHSEYLIGLKYLIYWSRNVIKCTVFLFWRKNCLCCIFAINFNPYTKLFKDNFCLFIEIKFYATFEHLVCFHLILLQIKKNEIKKKRKDCTFQDILGLTHFIFSTAFCWNLCHDYM